MTESSIYYLHENMDLIHKVDLEGTAADIRDSDLAVGMWFLRHNSRLDAWNLLVEALASGAKRDRVISLAEKWKCHDEDAVHYSKLVNVELGIDGNTRFARSKDTFVNIQESNIGHGETCLDALAEYAIAIGYKPSKIWGQSFADLAAKENKGSVVVKND